jgi:thioredoxin 1
MIARIGSQDFDGEVLGSNIPVFLCVSTSSCRPCFALCVVVEMLADEYGDRIKFFMIDAEEEPQLAEEHGVAPLPAVLIYKHGKVEKKLVGFHSKGHLMSQLDALLAEEEHTAPTPRG